MYVRTCVSLGMVQLLTSLRRDVVLIFRWADISRQIPFTPSTPPSQGNLSLWSIPWCLTPLPAQCFKEVLSALIDSVMATQSEPKVTYFLNVRSELAWTPADCSVSVSLLLQWYKRWGCLVPVVWDCEFLQKFEVIWGSNLLSDKSVWKQLVLCVLSLLGLFLAFQRHIYQA